MISNGLAGTQFCLHSQVNTADRSQVADAITAHSSMATAISQAFLELKENLEITGLQSSTVSIRQTNVRDVIEAELEALDPFLSDSSLTRATNLSANKIPIPPVIGGMLAAIWPHRKNPGAVGKFQLA
jgi:hypothetical protein